MRVKGRAKRRENDKEKERIKTGRVGRKEGGKGSH